MNEVRLARRMARMKPSSVREILKVAERPEIISFAGGLPAPELFPVAELAEAHERVFAREARAALQYGLTEGHLPLREWIAHRLVGRGIPASAQALLITNGSQQGLDLIGRMLLDPGDGVLVEAPTYLAALQAFAAYGARFVEVEGDHQGMLPEALAAALRHGRPKLLYLVPEFQNPKGTTLSRERRAALLRLAAERGVVVVEDDPYGELRFRGAPLPPLASLEEGATVLHLGTFSKTLAPGLRVGWVHGPAELLRKLTILKQAADLHTGTLAQRATAALLESFDYDAHLARLREVYGERRDAMVAALERHFPPGGSWTRPDGGLFLWVGLPPGARDEEVFRRALAEGVAVVPGCSFFADGGRHDFVRLNYSNQPPERIAEGVRRLAQACVAVGEAARVG